MRHVVVFVALMLAAAPAAAQTGNPPPKTYPLPPPPVVITTPGGHDTPARIETTDRASHCLQYAKSIGVPADQMDDYMKRCVLQ